MISRANAATLIFSIGKIIHSAGLNLFSAEQFGQYISKTTEPEGIDKLVIESIIFLAILHSVGVNIFVNIPAFHRNITNSTSSNAAAAAEPAIIPSLQERMISTPLKSGAWTYTIMMSILGYFLTHKLSDLMATLTGTQDDDTIWKTVMVDIAGIAVAAIVFLKYATYDMHLCNQNADRIAHSVVHRDIPINKAMVISALLSLLTLTIYPMQAFFFAKPALENTPGIQRSQIAVDLLTLLGCIGTFITAFTWLPSIYDFFNQQSGANQLATHPDTAQDNLLLRSLKAAAYVTGLNDATVQGMSAYMGVIAVSGALDAHPYAPWVVTLAALAMLNTTIIHTSFSVVPGVTATMSEIRARRSRNSEPDIEHGVSSARLFNPAPNASGEETQPLLALAVKQAQP
jgi:hypothetical protein